jgi:ABC-type molybdate transport system permease subunit
MAIYDTVEALDYHSAHIYGSVLLAFSFLTLLSVHRLNRRLLAV